MARRMDRYYQTNSENNKRSRRNASLYDSIYDDDIEYSNIEGIARIEKTNEIDINRIREMLRKEEEKQTRKTFQPIVRSEIEHKELTELEHKEDRNYDLKDILTKAKEEKKDEEKDKYRNLKNTQYNILKNIKLDDEIGKVKKAEETKEKLKELIDTITNNSLLNELADKDLSLELLEDLKSNTATIDQGSIKKILDEEKAKEEQKNEKKDDEKESTLTKGLDKSFFTSSLNFSDEDFEELRELGSTYRKNSILIKVLIILVVIALIVMVALYYIKLK